MSEGQQGQTYNRPAAAPIDAFCDALRDSLHSVADFFTPPRSALDHFRESRIEMLKGVREIIDHRIDRLSRRGSQGSRVSVD